jgi:hypothetical protein
MEDGEGNCSDRISKLLLEQKFNSFPPEYLETALIQNECFVFRSPHSTVLCLNVYSSVMAASLLARPGDL